MQLSHADISPLRNLRNLRRARAPRADQEVALAALSPAACHWWENKSIFEIQLELARLEVCAPAVEVQAAPLPVVGDEETLPEVVADEPEKSSRRRRKSADAPDE
jgi:hypothetical protein